MIAITLKFSGKLSCKTFNFSYWLVVFSQCAYKDAKIWTILPCNGFIVQKLWDGLCKVEIFVKTQDDAPTCEVGWCHTSILWTHKP